MAYPYTPSSCLSFCLFNLLRLFLVGCLVIVWLLFGCCFCFDSILCFQSFTRRTSVEHAEATEYLSCISRFHTLCFSSLLAFCLCAFFSVLHFWRDVSSLSNRITHCVPQCAHFMAALVQFEHLHSMRHKLDVVSGFDMRAYDDAVYPGATSMSTHQLWEHDHTLLSEPASAIPITFLTKRQDINTTTQITAVSRGHVHAFVVFVNINFDDQHVVTGYSKIPSPTIQAVYMLETPLSAEAGQTFTLLAHLGKDSDAPTFNLVS
eukprot:m.189778 g.189778  ORF g.189778 m.189778 type:complete len:263 (-) comp14800_c1_seq1:1580-2368(-)